MILPMKVRAHVFFDGRVQGVSFRYFTRDIACSQHVTGWVRNLHDGRVEAVFEGERSDVEQTIIRCQNENPFARVTDADATWEDRIEGFIDFSITY
jgi:acylphosphatase